METRFSIAVTCDSIINRRISVLTDERFVSMIKILQDADVAYTHLETLIHDYEGPELYPTADIGTLYLGDGQALREFSIEPCGYTASKVLAIG